jgi:hypothetical protein
MPGVWSEYPDFPFCGRRCRTIDLGRWLSEDYQVATGDSPPADHATPDELDTDR